MNEKELQVIKAGRMNPPPRVQGSGSPNSLLDWINNGAQNVYCQGTGSGGSSGGGNSGSDCYGAEPGSKPGSLRLTWKGPFCS